jgi:type II secretion system protein G
VKHRCTARTQGFTLIELLVVIIIIGILAAIAIPMFLGQRDKAKESAVKGGVHNIELGVASYAVDNGDNYPASVADQDELVNASLDPYVDQWPDNPWTAEPMVDSTDEGDYTYTPSPAGGPYTGFSLVGHGTDGRDVITAP